MKNILNLAITAVLTLSASALDKNHEAFTTLLKKHVSATGVNYKDFKNEQPALKSYLKDLYAVKPTEFNGWSGSDQLSYLINLYNAATIDLVLENYPIKSFKAQTHPCQIQ